MTDHIVWHSGSVSREDRASVTGGRGVTVWLTGLSGSGKSTIGRALESELVVRRRAAYVLDGDNLRFGLNSDLDFSSTDRNENVRRVSHVAQLLADAGLVAVVPIISPYAEGRDRARLLHEENGLGFIEVFVDTPLEICEKRDPKGIYKRARAGEILNMTGIDDPYEAPKDPDVRIVTQTMDVEEAVGAILNVMINGER
jgi:adenylyl-sulfate kinase